MEKLEDLLLKQAQKYRSLTNLISCLEEALEEQLKIKASQSIPHKYKPKLLFTENDDINKNFCAQFEQIFFEYLNQTIRNNQIKAAQSKTELKTILERTDEHVLNTEATDQQLRFHYYKFLRENDIVHHTPIPQLLHRLQTSVTDLPKTVKRNRR